MGPWNDALWHRRADRAWPNRYPRLYPSAEPPAQKRPGVTERFVVPLKPGNAGGGKGPQFKTDAISGEGPEDWATLQLR